MIYIRKAVAEDIRLVYDLSNEAQVRAVSIHQDPIPWETHVEWFRGILASKDHLLLLGFLDAELRRDFVGQVRFRMAIEGDAEVSISLRAEHRGRGLGREPLGAGLAAFGGHAPDKRLIARIRSSNETSLRLFRGAGFRENEGGNPVGSEVLTLVWRPL